MVSTEYTLVKWKDNDYEELEITISENSVRDFCEMMDWDEKEFSDNTIRRPIVCEEVDPENEEYIIEEIAQKENVEESIPKDKPPKTQEVEKDRKRAKRKRRTKAEIIADDKKPKEPKIRKRRKDQYTEEMEDFIRKNSPLMRNKELVEKFNEEFNTSKSSGAINVFKNYKNIKGVGIGTGYENRVSKPKIYTDEVIQYLRDNINNFSNAQFVEELSFKFNIKTTIHNIRAILSREGIKRDIQSDIDQEILDFISNSKIKDVFLMRDEIIEKFEKNISTIKLKTFMNQRKNDLPGESVEEEVKRITNQREEIPEQGEIQEYAEDDEEDFLE